MKTYKELMEETKQNQFGGIPIPKMGDIFGGIGKFALGTVVSGALSALIPRPGGANPAKQTQDQANIAARDREYKTAATLDRQRQDDQAKMARYSQGAPLGTPQERIKPAKTNLGSAQTEYTP